MVKIGEESIFIKKIKPYEKNIFNHSYYIII
jgi:hypothetical protein